MLLKTKLEKIMTVQIVIEMLIISRYSNHSRSSFSFAKKVLLTLVRVCTILMIWTSRPKI